jgi:hypothetical protein
MMNTLIRTAILCFLMQLLAVAPVIAQSFSSTEMRSLDEQVQEIKSDVLDIAAELSRLEETLLYPSNTHVAIFVAMTPDETFRLDSMQIAINDQLATHYIYAFKELDALQQGGVHRIYTGNIASGTHRLEVTVKGRTQGGRDFSRTESFSFRKDVEPKLLNITLSGPETVRLGEW